jgi:hypothetical protein
MNLETYQRAAERTMLDTQPVSDVMLNAALGLCGEAAEVASAFREHNSAHVLEESGDLLWYVAQMCRAYGKSIADIPPFPLTGWDTHVVLEALWSNTGFIADMTKKCVFHQKPINTAASLASLQSIVSMVSHILMLYGYTLSDACEHNTAKLLKRFPAGFTPADANARKDEAHHAD